jgi:hypothetical protein
LNNKSHCWSDGYCRWKFSTGNLDTFIDLSDRERLRNEPAPLGLRCIALPNWATEASCRALTTSSCKY